MAFPVEEVKFPRVLRGQNNGELPESIRVATPGQAGGPDVVLVAPAARAWRALTGAARGDGVLLKSSCTFCSYRPFSEQKRIFLDRYTTTGTGEKRVFEGKTFFKRPGVATAAVPGTSNHGRGLAVDTGVELDGDPSTEKLDKATLNWLLDHALDFGWSWEIQSEPWHLRYFAGDTPPAAVVDLEPEVTVGVVSPANLDLEDPMICAILDHVDRRFQQIAHRDPDLEGRNFWVHRFTAAEQSGDADKVLEVENDLLVALTKEAGPGG